MSADTNKIKQWLIQQLPATLTNPEPELTLDEEDLLVILNLNTESLTGEGEARKQAEAALIEQVRNETKQVRIHLTRKLARHQGLIVSWGMRAGDSQELFTNNNTTPVMTRLNREERRVLDTLIAANVANTRSTALSYIVRTFATDHQDWLKKVEDVYHQISQLGDELKQSKPQTGE